MSDLRVLAILSRRGLVMPASLSHVGIKRAVSRHDIVSSLPLTISQVHRLVMRKSEIAFFLHDVFPCGICDYNIEREI